MKKVIVYRSRHLRRSLVLTEAAYKGLSLAGYKPVFEFSDNYRGSVDADMVVFYGLHDNLLNIYRDYIAAGKTTIQIDLGYFGRHAGGRLHGFHKMTVNGLQPSDQIKNKTYNNARVHQFKIELSDCRSMSGHILLAGMSEKAAKVYGLGPEEWEKSAIRQLRLVTDRQIKYRPKPSWEGARPIAGCTYSSKEGETLEAALNGAFAVVSHHSNVSFDGAIRGIPFTVDVGAGTVLSKGRIQNIEKIEPLDKVEVMQWCNNLAYTQWNVHEISNGIPFRFYRKEGLTQ